MNVDFFQYFIFPGDAGRSLHVQQKVFTVGTFLNRSLYYIQSTLYSVGTLLVLLSTTVKYIFNIESRVGIHQDFFGRML